jgi:hypothetical protein
VAHTSNLRYLGGGDQEDHGSEARWQIVCGTLSQKNLSRKRAGGAAQSVGPGFKPQYQKKKKKKQPQIQGLNKTAISVHKTGQVLYMVMKCQGPRPCPLCCSTSLHYCPPLFGRGWLTSTPEVQPMENGDKVQGTSSPLQEALKHQIQCFYTPATGPS